jgi:hypothetical protein
MPKVVSDNPISDSNDRSFLLSVVNNKVAAVVRADVEKASVLALFNKPCTGKEPILRLIHALVNNDEIKHAYLE